MRVTVPVSALLAKLKPWGAAARRLFLGPNQEVLSWTELVRVALNLIPSYYDVLRVVATHMGREAWDDMRLCIEWIVERVSWSRRTVERALRYLKANRILLQDGELQVRHGSPVVRYRLGGTPECPLPWAVDGAREAAREAAFSQAPDWEETAGQGGSGVHTSFTGPTVLVGDQGDTPEEKFMSPTAGVSNYRSASPIKAGPQAKPQPSGTARRGPHLRWLRSVAEGLLARGGTTGPTGTVRASQDRREGLSVSLGRYSMAAVTYGHTPTRGAAVQPFIDPVFGNLSRDTRLLYLGLREAHTRGERTYSDTLFLKSQFFPYDTDIDAPYLQSLLSTLVAAGKAHIVDGDVVLSDPPVTSKEVALLVTPPKRIRAKAPLEDPWFAAFWELYPRRTGKGAARKAYITAVTSGASPQAINDAAASYADRCGQLQKEPQFIPHPSTWLNQERWEDDEEQAPRVRSKVDDALRSGLDLVSFYQQQEAIPFDGPKELGW